MKNSIRTLALTCSALLGVVVLPALTMAQQVFVAPRAAIAVGGQQVDWNAAIKEQLEKQKLTWQQEMKILLADIDAACQLSAEQKSKLEVAAKGAIEKSLASFKDQQGQMNAVPLQAVAGAPLDVGGGVVRVEQANQQQEQEVKEKGAAEKAEQADKGEAELQVANTIEIQALPAGQPGVAVRLGGPLGWMSSASGESPAEQEIWKKTFKMTLTEEQSTTYGQVAKSRADKARTASIGAFVAKVDVKLLLNEKQNSRLNELLVVHYSDVNFENVAGFGGIGFFGGDEVVDNGPFLEGLASVLSETQLEIWKENFQTGLDFAKMANGVRVQRAMPAMRLAPAVPVVPDKQD